MPVASASSRNGRVLVTGAKGFTGRHLIPELDRQGYSVIEHSEEQCDLRDAEAVKRFISSTPLDFVIHLAAISFVPHGSPAEIYQVNTVGTTNLLDALAAHRPAALKVVLASSSQVYGNAASGELDETSLCRPSSHYACSKLAMEHMAAIYGDRLPIIITRPFNYTGPGQPTHFLVPKIVAHFARKAAMIELGNTEVVRDFSDVRLVVDAYCRLLHAPCRTGTFNICSGVGRSLRWLLEETGRIAGGRITVKVNTDLVRSGEVERMIGCNRKLVDAIGPLRHSDFSETLRWMLQDLGALRTVKS
jgi:nucleoside-diphosphate-sugar epimerase